MLRCFQVCPTPTSHNSLGDRHSGAIFLVLEHREMPGVRRAAQWQLFRCLGRRRAAPVEDRT